MKLKEAITLNQHGTQSISEFLQSIKATTEELALNDTPLTKDDLTLHVLNGLGVDYKDIVALTRVQKTSLNFEGIS